MAAVRVSCLARNGQSPGEESLTAAVAAQAVEAQPSFGQIKPSEVAWRRSGSPEEKTWRILSEPHKRPAHRAKKRKTLRADGRGHSMPGTGSRSASIADCVV